MVGAKSWCLPTDDCLRGPAKPRAAVANAASARSVKFCTVRSSNFRAAHAACVHCCRTDAFGPPLTRAHIPPVLRTRSVAEEASVKTNTRPRSALLNSTRFRSGGIVTVTKSWYRSQLALLFR